MQGHKIDAAVKGHHPAIEQLLGIDLLPTEILRGEDPASPPVFASDGLVPLREAEQEFRKQHLRRALAVTGGNQTKAAKILGIQRSSLNRQMKELGLREESAVD